MSTYPHHKEGSRDDWLGQSDRGDCLWDERRTAAYLGIAPKTLRQWRTQSSNLLPHVKLGRLARYRRSAVEALIRSSIRNSTSDDPSAR